jgi:hypothetical protein
MSYSYIHKQVWIQSYFGLITKSFSFNSILLPHLSCRCHNHIINHYVCRLIYNKSNSFSNMLYIYAISFRSSSTDFTSLSVTVSCQLVAITPGDTNTACILCFTDTSLRKLSVIALTAYLVELYTP